MSTKQKPAKRAARARTDWRGMARRYYEQLTVQGKELHAVSAALVRQEDMTKQAHERGNRFETANLRARIHWENRRAWFYFRCAFRALIGKQNNTNGIDL